MIFVPVLVLPLAVGLVAVVVVVDLLVAAVALVPVVGVATTCKERIVVVEPSRMRRTRIR